MATKSKKSTASSSGGDARKLSVARGSEWLAEGHFREPAQGACSRRRDHARPGVVRRRRARDPHVCSYHGRHALAALGCLDLPKAFEQPVDLVRSVVVDDPDAHGPAG